MQTRSARMRAPSRSHQQLRANCNPETNMHRNTLETNMHMQAQAHGNNTAKHTQRKAQANEIPIRTRYASYTRLCWTYRRTRHIASTYQYYSFVCDAPTFEEPRWFCQMELTLRGVKIPREVESKLILLIHSIYLIKVNPPQTSEIQPQLSASIENRTKMKTNQKIIMKNRDRT